MATLVKDIWLLDRQANARSGYWRQYLLLTVAGLVTITIVFWALWWLGAELQGGSVLEGQQNWLNGYLIITPLVIGMLCFLLHMARQVDRESAGALGHYFDAQLAAREHLEPRAIVWRTICVINVLLVYGTTTWMNYQAVEAGGAVFADMVVPEFLLPHIPLALYGVAMGVVGAVVWQYYWYNMELSQRVRIELLNVDVYTPLILPSLYLMIWTLLSLSAFGCMYILMPPEIWEPLEHIVRLCAIGSAVTPIYAALFFIPVIRLQRRIAAEKARQLDTVNLAIAGDASALQDTWIARCAESHSLADLYAHRAFVDGVWTWPISAQLGRIGFFVLLPPITWVMAAFVENLMFG